MWWTLLSRLLVLLLVTSALLALLAVDPAPGAGLPSTVGRRRARAADLVVLMSPVLVPVWALGWWRLLRDPSLRVWRPLAVAFVVLLGLVLVPGGKPLLRLRAVPMLLAAGAEPVARWLGAGARSVRRWPLVAAAVGLAVNVILFLPVVPADRLAATPIVDINYDAGEAGAIHHLRPRIPVRSGGAPGPPRPGTSAGRCFAGAAERGAAQASGATPTLVSWSGGSPGSRPSSG